MAETMQGSVRRDMERDRAVYEAQRQLGRARLVAFIACVPVVVYLSVRTTFGDGVDAVFNVLAGALGT